MPLSTLKGMNRQFLLPHSVAAAILCLAMPVLAAAQPAAQLSMPPAGRVVAPGVAPGVVASSSSLEAASSPSDGALAATSLDAALLEIGAGAQSSPAQSSVTQPAAGTVLCGITHLVRCVEDLGQDDKGIFTSPARFHKKDLRWALPLGAVVGLAIAYDADAQQALGVNTSLQSTANTFSNFGSFYASGAEGAGLYFAGLAAKNPKLAETGRLGAEAVIDSGTVTLLIKLVSNRHRPLQGNGQGNFWAEGTSHWQWDTSFPSDHATASMSLARVIAGEYPRWYIQTAAYGFAEGISLARVLAKEHFPSDVIVGQTIGFLTGSYVLHHRALYAGYGHRSLVSRVVDQVHPVLSPSTRTLGAGIDIAFGQ